MGWMEMMVDNDSWVMGWLKVIGWSEKTQQDFFSRSLVILDHTRNTGCFWTRYPKTTKNWSILDAPVKLTKSTDHSITQLSLSNQQSGEVVLLCHNWPSFLKTVIFNLENWGSSFTVSSSTIQSPNCSYQPSNMEKLFCCVISDHLITQL